MSSVDSRIVQMQFENSQFEKGIRESLKSIDDLEKKLEFKDAEKSLAALQKAGDSFSLASMADGIEKIGEKFSVLGVIGKRVLEDLTDSAVRMGEQFIKSITTDQITAGWDKYANKTQAVQTIIAATGKDIEYVDAQLERLAWFTDETSYDFVAMTNNIGKFTSMGIDLETSVTAMEGIATWAAVSGANAQEASRAMYNMSQALGVGSVKLMDWKSIENANMATKEFKQTAIETAKAMGKLNAQGKTAKGTAVTYENFAQTLSEGWFTKDVLISTLQKYGEYADAVYSVATEKGINAAQAMELVSGNTMELGEKAFKAAQEAKTYAEAINAVKDAVSSGWMNIFENIFGNYEEAKELWTDLANYLWEMFAAPLSSTNELLAKWKEAGGRAELFQGIYDIFEGIANIVATVGDAIDAVFPKLTSQNLVDMSRAVADFGKQFKQTFGRYETEIRKPIKKESELDKQIRLVNEGYGEERTAAIRAVQAELEKLGYLSEKDYVSGTWGPSSDKALENFQNGVKKTEETLKTSLKFGDKGEEVKEFQQQLKDLNFDPGAVDGIWGPKTQQAYDDYIASLGRTFTEYKELKKGMRDEDVRTLQFELIQAGYLDAGQADGIFGPKTENALKEWQKAHDIVESGIFDKDTYDSMYGEQAKRTGKSIEYETETVIDYSDKMKNLLYITRGAASALHILTSFFGFLGKVVGHIGSLFSPLIDAFIAISAALGNSITSFDQWLQEAGVFDKWFEDVKKFLQPFGDWIQKAADGLLAFFGISKNAKDSNSELMTFAKLWNNIKESVKKTGIIDKVTAAWNKFKASLDKIKGSLDKTSKTFKENLGKKFTEFLTNLPVKIASVVEWLGNLVSDGLDLISPWIEKIPGAIDKIKGFWDALTQKGDSSKNQAPGFLIRVKDAFKSVIDFLFGEGDIANGKQPGVFRRLGKLIKGDIEGFTEGFDEKTKTWVLDKIEGIKVFFQKVREAIVYMFGGELSDDKKISDDALAKIDRFKDTFAKIFEAIGLLFTGEVKEKSKLSKETQDKIISIRNTIIGVFGVIKQTLADIWNTIVGVFKGDIKFDSVGDFFKNIWEKIKKLFTDIGGVASQNLGTTFEGITTFFSNLWENVKKLGKWALIGFVIYKVGSTLGNLSGVFKSLKETIKSFKKDSQPLAKSILEFAIAVGIIAGSIWLIGQLDAEQLKRGAIVVGGIIALMIILLGIFALSDKAKGASTALKKFGESIKDLAIGIAIIAGTIVLLGWLVPWDTLLSGLGKLVVILAVLGIFMYALNKSGGTKIQLKGFYQLAIVIAVMALVTVALGKLKMATLLKGLLGLAVIMGLLIGLFAVIGKTGSGNVKLKGLFSLAIVIAVMAIVVKRLGKMKMAELGKGLLALAVIMGALIALVFVMGKFGKDLKMGPIIAIFVGLAAVIWLFGETIKKIKDVDPALLYAFSISLALALGAFVAACLIVGKMDEGPSSMLKGAGAIGGAMIILAAALTGIVYGVGKLDEIDPGVINRGKTVLKTIGEACSGFRDALDLTNGEVALILGASSILGSNNSSSGANYAFGMIKGAASIGLSLLVLATALTGIVYGAGKLEAIDPGVIESGKTVLISVGSAITGFADALGITKEEVGLILGVITGLGSFGTGTGSLAKGTIFGSLAIGGSIAIIVGALAGITFGLGKIEEISPGTIEKGKNVLKTVGEGITGFASAMQLSGDEVVAIFAAAEILGMLDGAWYKMILGSLGLSAGLSSMIAVLTLITAALGGIDQLAEGGFIDAVKRGKELFTQVGEALGGFINGIKEGIFGKKVDPDALASEKVESFGTAFQIFKDAVSGFSADTQFDSDITTATGVVEKLYTFFQTLAEKLPDGQSLVKYNAQIDSILGDVESFGTSMGTFRTNVSGISSTDIEADTAAAIKAATAIADFLVNLKGQSDKIDLNRGAIEAFIGKDTVQGTVFDAIEALGTAVQSARTNIKGISGGTFEADLASAMTALTKIVGILAYVKKNEIGASTYEETNFEDILRIFELIGQHIVDFNQQMQNNNVSDSITTSVATIMNSVATLSEVLSGEGKNKITTENFLSGIDFDSVSASLTDFSTSLQLSLNNVVSDIEGYVDTFSQKGIDFAAAISTGMSDTTITGASTAVDAAINSIEGDWKQFYSVGKNFVQGLANGMAFRSMVAIMTAKAIAVKMLNAITSTWRVASPSKVTTQYGRYFTEGLANGAEDRMSKATNSVENVANSMLNTASGTLATLSSLLTDDIDVNPVIAPVVDLSNARASAAMIGGLFGNQSFGVTSNYMANQALVSTNNGRPVTIQNGTINTSEAMASVNEKLNALNAALNNRNDGPHVDVMETLGEKFGELANAVTNLKVVLDSGTLVGEISGMMDSDLGDLAMKRDRGN